MKLFLTQVRTLVWKDVLIALVRRSVSTPLRALVLPIVFVWFLGFARNLFIAPSVFGIGDASPVRNLTDAIDIAAQSGRTRLVFVNNGLGDGDVGTVIDRVAAPVRASGRTVEIYSNETVLETVCKTTLRGVSTCYAAVVFASSPNQGSSGIWNYTIRADGALDEKIVSTSSKNDQDVYLAPLQHAIDVEIAALNKTTDHYSIPSTVDDYLFTSMTQEERNDSIRIRYMGGIIDILGVAFYIGIVGVTYQLVGMIATERELGIAQLMDAMMPNPRRWQPQAARLLSHHLAFDLIYLPGWIVMAIFLGSSVFQKTSPLLLVIFNVIAGLSLSSFSTFLAAFFRRAQLSGIISVIMSLLLAIIAQIATAKSDTGTIVILSLLFPPMNYTYFIILTARWEQLNRPANLVQTAPNNPWKVSGLVLWCFLIIQIIVFPVLGAYVERALYGTASRGRSIGNNGSNSHELEEDVVLKDFTKVFQPSWIHRNIGSRFGGHQKEGVLAVNKLSFTALKGEILVLLGANGSGKSTTLDAISGLTKVTSGDIEVNGSGGLGLCPQKNVLWDELTVREHVQIFNRLKSIVKADSKDEIHALITACDLDRKLNAKARTLSGGQKRKLQLAMMFTGGSRVCAIDEVSSGIDPLSRRKIWDILLAERGSRTMILTTHFLDEADLLSDRIVIMSRGNLKAEGSAAELKEKLGGGYRIQVNNDVSGKLLDGTLPERLDDGHKAYSVSNSAEAARLMRRLDDQGVHNYQVLGPSIENVFLKLAEEIRNTEEVGSNSDTLVSEKSDDEYEEYHTPELLTGRRISMLVQTYILFKKRLVILRRNFLAYFGALVIPIVAAGLTSLYLSDITTPNCEPNNGQVTYGQSTSLGVWIAAGEFDVAIGPRSKLSSSFYQNVMNTLSLPDGSSSSSSSSTNSSTSNLLNMTALTSGFHFIDTLDEFNDYISTKYANVTPGGIYLGDDDSPPTFAYKGNSDISAVTITQNILHIALTNMSISHQYQPFDDPWNPSSGKSLQLIAYFGLAMAAYPALFGLYPNMERLRNVRSLHYSNGVRTLPLWTAYLLFDFAFVVIGSVVSIIIYVGVSSTWWNPGYLFLIFLLYGLTSTLLSYVISLFAPSQLATFAFSAGYQAAMFLIYFIGYLSVLTYAPTEKVDSYVTTVHFFLATITPSGNLIRAFFIAFNEFEILCRGSELATYPGELTLYGGPILYLFVQSAVLFALLLWWDSGISLSLFRCRRIRSRGSADPETTDTTTPDLSSELARARTSQSKPGLSVLHLSKTFHHTPAVSDITFSVPHDQVFALLGPNGAGKSTTISMIRGDLSPTTGSITVESLSALHHRAAARSHLGVCPQFDAMDQMTVLEHLRFYARVRGIEDVNHNVREVLRAVGLQPFKHRMANKLSGGNKRKLSLGIALMGNPTVLLLDEPSSGMDAASKRIMWRTLASVVPGRSLVLTTHSMEEADALADRAGIIARRMLAIDSCNELRRRFGGVYHVQIVMRSAPHTPEAEIARVQEWVRTNLKGAQGQEKTYAGQLRFSVPTTFNKTTPDPEPQSEPSSEKSNSIADSDASSAGISALFTLLEASKDELGFAYYSVAQTSLDQVFLAIVGAHDVEEENYESNGRRERRKWLCCFG